MGPLLIALAGVQLAAMSSGAVALAQSSVCAPQDADLPLEFAGWTRPGERLEQFWAVVLRASDNRDPGDPPGLTASIAFSVPAHGVYAIAVDRDGGVGVQPVMDRGPGLPLAPVSDEGGPDCSSIRHLVRFELNPGTYYSLGLTGLSGNSVRVMLVAPGEADMPNP